MFRRVRFECDACGAGFVDWHDEEWERSPVFCVNCGEPIAVGIPISEAQMPLSSPKREGESALGILKGVGEGFRDTLPGLEAAAPFVPNEDRAPSSFPEPPRQSESGSEPAPQRPVARATSTRPEADDAKAVEPMPRRRALRSHLTPVAAMLLGFTAGVPLTLLAQRLGSAFHRPAASSTTAIAEQLATAASALDDGDLNRARALLDGITTRVPASDRRVATLRARLSLSLILAQRPDEARRELVAIPEQTRVFPAREELEHAYAVMFADKPREVAAAASSKTAANPAASVRVEASSTAITSAAKPVFTPQVMLAAARDRQRRSRLDEAQQLYEEVLRYRPNDSEARCGLGEIQLLRGSVTDAKDLFESVLRTNPNYVPAWVALADIDWLNGRPERAACRYQLVVDRFPEGSYPPYITQRIARVMGSGATPPLAKPDAAPPEACN